MEASWAQALLTAGVVGVVILVAVVLMLAVARSLIHVCRPNEVLVFAGRRHSVQDGGSVGFRVVSGGRAVRIPLLERVERMDMSLLSVPMSVTGAYSLGGIPLTVQAVANVKVSSEPEVLGNALERFLGHSRATIAEVARETLEGNLRGVLATLTPEEVNGDRTRFAQCLLQEADQDLKKLGLALDTLKIQSVSDDRGYLNALGRKQSAELQMRSRIAEAENQALSAERAAHNREVREVAWLEAELAMARANAERRILEARARRAAGVAEERAAVGGPAGASPGGRGGAAGAHRAGAAAAGGGSPQACRGPQTGAGGGGAWSGRAHRGGGQGDGHVTLGTGAHLGAVGGLGAADPAGPEAGTAAGGPARHGGQGARRAAHLAGRAPGRGRGPGLARDGAERATASRPRGGSARAAPSALRDTGTGGAGGVTQNCSGVSISEFHCQVPSRRV
ncbi:flotillin family protein [Archangium sp.]|uniref:flotillin family protein n=1 Tax=Archangium sp. TaxID=1872627 RepID=UPI00286A4610|nr:flotillin family protein [Archangium sp.]